MYNEEENIYNNYDKLLTHRISRISFIFVSIVIIAGGYATHILSCDTQRFFNNSIYAKHLLGIILIFMFIMLEGGWEFKTSLGNENVYNWSNGNSITSLLYAILLYFLLLLTSKMRYYSTILFFFLLFKLYFINTQRLNYLKKELISNDINHKIVLYETFIFWLLPIILICGIVDYYFYKKKELGKNFNLFVFLLGCTSCKKN